MPEAVNSEFYSRFGGLWIDRKDSADILARRVEAGQIDKPLADSISRFMRDGYVVLKGAVPKSETRALRDEIEQFWKNPDDDARVETYEVPGHVGVALVKPVEAYKFGATKLLDYQAFSPRLRDAVANSPAVTFLTAIFDAKPKAFQGLTFWRGSEQPIHKDTAYVRVTGEPMHLAASWLALEDVILGTGELEYFVGSHRAPDYLFGGHSKWLIDSPTEHPAFLQSLHDDAQRYNYRTEAFLAEEGDVLIWHADLAHGGGRITKPGQSRQSHVTHFTTANDDPPYMVHRPQTPLEQNDCLFVSEHRPFT